MKISTKMTLTGASVIDVFGLAPRRVALGRGLRRHHRPDAVTAAGRAETSATNRIGLRDDRRRSVRRVGPGRYAVLVPPRLTLHLNNHQRHGQQARPVSQPHLNTQKRATSGLPPTDARSIIPKGVQYLGASAPVFMEANRWLPQSTFATLRQRVSRDRATVITLTAGEVSDNHCARSPLAKETARPTRSAASPGVACPSSMSDPWARRQLLRRSVRLSRRGVRTPAGGWNPGARSMRFTTENVSGARAVLVDASAGFAGTSRLKTQEDAFPPRFVDALA